MNPMNLLQFKNTWDTFRSNHPKFPKFLSAVCQKSIQEGTVIEIRVTTHDGRETASNIRLKADDVTLFEQLREWI